MEEMDDHSCTTTTTLFPCTHMPACFASFPHTHTHLPHLPRPAPYLPHTTPHTHTRREENRTVNIPTFHYSTTSHVKLSGDRICFNTPAPEAFAVNLGLVPATAVSHFPSLHTTLPFILFLLLPATTTYLSIVFCLFPVPCLPAYYPPAHSSPCVTAYFLFTYLPSQVGQAFWNEYGEDWNLLTGSWVPLFFHCFVLYRNLP